MDTVGQHIAEEAADWLVRLDEGGAACHGDFVTWLKRSPRHMEEFLMVEASFRAVQQFYPRDRAGLEELLREASAEVVPLKTARREHESNRNRRWPWVAAAAAALIGVAALGPSLFSPSHYATAVGEQRAFKLPDGSLLSLNTQSRVEIDFSKQAREIRLVRGEALFTVKQDVERPFRVSTETAVVQAIGTSFNVYQRPDNSTFVSVMEGRVNVTPAGQPSAPLPLAAGEEANVSQSGDVVRRAAPDVDHTVSWRQRRLVFRGTALAAVVEEFNRYNADIRLHVASVDIAQRRITGTFDADEPQAFVRFLAEDASVQLEHRGGDVEIRSRDGR